MAKNRPKLEKVSADTVKQCKDSQNHAKMVQIIHRPSKWYENHKNNADSQNNAKTVRIMQRQSK